MGAGVGPGVVVGVAQRAVLSRELADVGLRGLVGREAPALEEVGQVALGRGAGQADDVLLLAAAQDELGPLGRGRRLRSAGVAVHAREEAVVEGLLVRVVQLVRAAGVVGQAQLPVHGQLREHAAGAALVARGHAVVHVIVAEPGRGARAVGLRQLREVVVRHLGVGVLGLVDIVPDLVRDAPSEVRPGSLLAVAVHRDRRTLAEPRDRIPLDADVVARRVHERAREHARVADVEMLRGQQVALDHGRVGSRVEGIGQALVLVEQLHHLIHGVERGEQPSRALVGGARTRPGQHLLGRYRVHHLVEHDVGGVQDAVLGIVAVAHRRVSAGSVQLAVALLQGRHVGLQRLDVGRGAREALGRVVHLVQIQHGHRLGPADAHAPIGGIVIARVLHVQLAAVFDVERRQAGDRYLVAAHLERCWTPDAAATPRGAAAPPCR